ncbi:hypothetical protein [Solemya pervernicosa gill symbiont]|uniref:hypothetical protein n=1 Tax=Solemya pervernicosa gill symbiont TaxID=642797 RepID=UPI0010843D09|nr:hypothetical protein [Solemya pervernicosa gill symbiont]
MAALTGLGTHSYYLKDNTTVTDENGITGTIIDFEIEVDFTDQEFVWAWFNANIGGRSYQLMPDLGGGNPTFADVYANGVDLVGQCFNGSCGTHPGQSLNGEGALVFLGDNAEGIAFTLGAETATGEAITGVGVLDRTLF